LLNKTNCIFAVYSDRPQIRDTCLYAISLSLPLYQQLSGRRPTRRSRPASPPLLRHKIEKRKRKNRKYVRAASSLWEVIKRQPKIKKRKKKYQVTKTNSPIRVLISSSPFSCVLNIKFSNNKNNNKNMRRNWKFERRLRDFFHLNNIRSLSLNKTKSPPSSLAFAARPFERRWRCERRVPESKAKRSFTHTEREKGF
jgi:hypothetical protein